MNKCTHADREQIRASPRIAFVFALQFFMDCLSGQGSGGERVYVSFVVKVIVTACSLLFLLLPK